MELDMFAPESNSVLSSKDYSQFKMALRETGCQKCGELCRDRHNIVVDRGNADTDLVVIGEAPGENEDLQGASFVGRAGQLLDKIMASIDLDTNRDMLILNVVKCRPPKNRAPLPEEAKNCFPYLEWQLKNVKPKVVVLLGATAAKYFLPKKKSTNMRDLVGNFFDHPQYPGVAFQLLYHPAYILRDPRKKPLMLEHVKKLQAHLNNVVTPECLYRGSTADDSRQRHSGMTTVAQLPIKN